MKWFLLFTKRNFKKISFIVVLLLIPIVTFGISVATNDSSIMRVGYCCEGEAKSSTEDIFLQLKNDPGMIDFGYYDNPQSGRDALDLGQIDILWIFPEDTESAVRKYYSSEADSVVKVFRREADNVSNLADEKLYCVIYPYVSYTIYSNYMTERLPKGDTLTEEDLQKYYKYKGISGDIVDIVTVDNTGVTTESEINFLMSPIRGILAIIIMLSGLVSAMYTLSDIKRGLYAVFSPAKRIVLCFASVLSSVIPTSIAVIITLAFTGMLEGLWDVVRILPFITACVSLGILMMGIFRTPQRLGAVIPIFTVVSLIFSPIFFNASFNSWVQGIFPTYHYLYSVSDTTHLLILLAYTLIAGGLGALSIAKNQ